MIDNLPDVISVAHVDLYCPPYMTSKDVALITGIPNYTLGRWADKGWISPVIEAKGSGTARVWHPSIVNEVVAIRQAIDRCPYGHNHDE